MKITFSFSKNRSLLLSRMIITYLNVTEPIADPLTCQINPGRETTIEIVSDNKGLGIFFVGGKDTQIPVSKIITNRI